MGGILCRTHLALADDPDPPCSDEEDPDCGDSEAASEDADELPVASTRKKHSRIGSETTRGSCCGATSGMWLRV